jgi:acetyl-CoA carboxylase carboxyltransferase component
MATTQGGSAAMTTEATDWSPEVAEIARRRELAAQMGGEEGIARQHRNGKYTVRERIMKLFDPGTFRELGSLTGDAEYLDGRLANFTPANAVVGVGEIDGRRVAVSADDFTIRGGASDGGGPIKDEWIHHVAHEWRIPFVRLIDGGSGSIRGAIDEGRTHIPYDGSFTGQWRLLSEVPVISAIVGPAAGSNAAKAVGAHFTIMVEGTGQIFVAGPPLVRRALGHDIDKNDLGGTSVHLYNGVADNRAGDEDDCFDQIRRYLSYLPQNAWRAPKRIETGDPPDRRDEALLSIIPRSRRRSYDIRKLLDLVLDRDSFFELGQYFGRSLVTGFARLDGYPVGITANDPKFNAGALDRDSSEKLMRFIDNCDAFHLPIVNFVDQPGFMLGRPAEAAGTPRMGMRALWAADQSTTPWVSVIVRKCFGVAGIAHYRYGKMNLRYAWPSAEWGVLPAEGGVEAAYRRQIANSPDPEAERARLEAEVLRYSSPLLTAEIFDVEDVIDPRETRPLLCDFARAAYDALESGPLGPKTSWGVRP